MREGTLILHFSGHGEKESNIEDFKYRNKGDLLCLENENHMGSTYLLSSDKLKKELERENFKIKIAIVASCHSE